MKVVRKYCFSKGRISWKLKGKNVFPKLVRFTNLKALSFALFFNKVLRTQEKYAVILCIMSFNMPYNLHLPHFWCCKLIFVPSLCHICLFNSNCCQRKISTHWYSEISAYYKGAIGSVGSTLDCLLLGPRFDSSLASSLYWCYFWYKARWSILTYYSWKISTKHESLNMSCFQAIWLDHN